MSTNMEETPNNEPLPRPEVQAFDEEAWYRDASGLADTILDQLGTERGSDEKDIVDADWASDELGKKFTLLRTKSAGHTRYSLTVTDTFQSDDTSRIVFTSNARGLYKVELGKERVQDPIETPEDLAWRCEAVNRYLMSSPADLDTWFAAAAEQMELDARLHFAAMDEIVRDEIVSRPDAETERMPHQGFYAVVEQLKKKYDLSDTMARKVFDIAEEQIERERLDGKQA